MLSVSSGYDTRYLTEAVGGGREGYYSAAVTAGEPPGQWYGSGAALLGLAGEVDADLMEAIYKELLDPRDPAAHDRSTWSEAWTLGADHKNYRTAEEIYEQALKDNPHAGPEKRADLWGLAEQAAKQAMSFLDLTFSAPKSWSVAAVAFERASNLAWEAGDLQEAAHWEELQRTLEEAMRVGARASIDYLEKHAGYGRTGHHGGGSGRWIDAHSWVVAQFLQHDSREHDPQLHIHQAVLNRQLCADGKWRALDTTAIKNWKAGAGAVGERAAEAYAAQRAGLAFRTRTDGVAREIVGVDQALMDQFSKRTHQIHPKVEALAAEFRERYGREPSLHERFRMAQQATLATRKAKEHDGESATQRMDRWVEETRGTVGQDLAETARAVVVAAAQPREAAQFSPADVKARALAAVGQDRAVWRESELTREIDRALPAEVQLSEADVQELLEGLTEEALEEALPARKGVDTTDAPEPVRLANGRSVFEAPGSRTWSTPEQVVGERLLREAAVTRGATCLTVEEAQAIVARYAENGVELGADQARALVGVLSSGAMLETIAAAPGTGKSFLLGAIADAWQATGRQMFGLATTQVAAEVLAGEGLTAANVTQWLGAQQRLAEGRASAADRELALRPGAIVTVDEASMTSWADLLAVQQMCDWAGAKLLTVGDPHQLSAVGPGGALADVAENGISYELTQVRRFRQKWEAKTSLDLRAGDRAAVAEYSKHGRLVSGGSVEATEQRAANAWLSDTLSGLESLLLVGSNADAARLSGQLRAELVALGKVSAEGVTLGLQDTTAGVWDLVQARRNGWDLARWEGNTAAPINRRTYEVTGIRADGGLTVAPIVGRSENGRELGAEMQLPASYVERHLALGYASTAHAAEGRTVDTGHCVYGTGMDAAGFLVSMTRGHERNTGYAVTRREPAKGASEPGEVAQVKERTAEAVLGDLLQRAELDRGALTQKEQAERDEASAMTNGDRLIDVVRQVTEGRTKEVLDRLVADGALSADNRARIAADPAMWSVDALLRRAELAGHDPVAALESAVRSRSLEDAAWPAKALHSRLEDAVGRQLTPAVQSFAEMIPAGVSDQWRPWLERHAAAADARRAELGTQIAIELPQWVLEALGDVPEDPVARLEWEGRAGMAGVYRELVGHDDAADALGDAPSAVLAEKHAMWRAGHEALGLSSAGPEEREASEGLLRMRVAALEREEAWAPAYVADELAAVSLAEAQARETSVVCSAKSLAEPDSERSAMLRDEAQQAAAELDTLREQRVALERADLERAMWSAKTAVTRDKAEAARDELSARGMDLKDPPDQTTAAEWLEAHRAELAEAEAAQLEVDEASVADPELEGLRAEEDAAPVAQGSMQETGLAETEVPDIRDTSTADAREHADSEKHGRVPAMAETRQKVDRAQAAVTEMRAREELDAAADTDQFEAAVTRYGDDRSLEDADNAGTDQPAVELPELDPVKHESVT
ncbi:MAG: relaxase domain-containing protein [Actinomycetota bacterium]|nr:relaxase domain-containing protein [Actinomycetota bacterium]